MVDSETYSKCVTDFVKYRDTATVLSAVKRVLDDNPNVAKFVGIEYTIKTLDNKEITPDLCSRHNPGAALLFELKWSVSGKTIKDELLDLRKYRIARFAWETGKPVVSAIDLILICHMDDAKIVVSAVNDLIQIPENKFLAEKGFAVWAWSIGLPKGSNLKAVEEMRLQCVHGKTANRELEKLIQTPGGIRIPHEVLEFLRFKYLFTKEKPPVQYTMAVLLLHVFTSFQKNTHSSEVLNITRNMLDMIYDRAKTFFPGWGHATEATIQTKKAWIQEAIDKFVAIKMNIVKLPLSRTRKQVQEILCERLEKLQRKRVRMPRLRRKRPSTVPTGQSKITNYSS